MMAKPMSAGIGITIGMSAPITQTSWKRVSNLANDRPRLASGASRCTIESKACFAALPVAPTVMESMAAPSRPPTTAVITPTTPVMTSAPTMMCSSVASLRTRGAATAPQKKPIWAEAATRPSSHRAPFSLMENASMNDRKPTMPRIEPMADDAATMPALRSSCFSTSPGGSAATVVGGICRANTVPMPNTTAPRATLQPPPPSLSRMPPGTAAATTASADSTVSLELASTSSSSLRTVPGTTALLEIE